MQGDWANNIAKKGTQLEMYTSSNIQSEFYSNELSAPHTLKTLSAEISKPRESQNSGVPL